MSTIDSFPPMPRLLSLKDVMDILSVKRSTIYNLIAKGDLKPVSFCGKVTFAESQIRQYIEDKIEASQAA